MIALAAVLSAACTEASGTTPAQTVVTSAAEVLTATPQTLQTVLSSAGPGSRIVLTPGRYGPVRLNGAGLAPGLQIDAGQAEVQAWFFKDAKGLTLTGGNWFPGPARAHPRTGLPTHDAALRCDGCADLTVENAVFKGPDNELAGRAIQIVGAERVTVRDSRFRELMIAMSLLRVDGFVLTGNRCERLERDCIIVGESRNGLIAENHASESEPMPGTHPDGIQLFSRPSSPPTSDVVIRDNVVTGKTQGIFLGNHVRHGIDDGGFDRITIERNVVDVSFPQGLSVQSARGLTLRGNRVSTHEGARWRASLNVKDSTDVRRCGNQVEPGAGKFGERDKPCPARGGAASSLVDGGF
jgi:hypothetical protein